MSETQESTQMYRIGQHVSGTVVEVLPYGVFVCLSNGEHAYIRRREMSWRVDTDPRKLVKKGDSLEGIIIELGGEGKNIELSYKETLPDPWDEFVEKSQVGDVVNGRVKNIVPYGAFVEIIPGVDGFVPLQELTTEDVESVEEVVWEGDEVEAVITSIESEKRKLRLSIRARLHQLAKVEAVWNELYVQEEEASLGLEMPEIRPGPDQQKRRDFNPSLIEKLGSILILEDQDEIRVSLVKWLQNMGCDAVEAKCFEEANELLQDGEFSLLLADMYLSNTCSLDLIREMDESEKNFPPIALMSIPKWIEKHTKDIQELQVLDVFAKPLNLEEIEALIYSIAAGETLTPWHVVQQNSFSQHSQPSQALVGIEQVSSTLNDRMRAILEKLNKDLKANMGVIFEVQSYSHEISIRLAVGERNLSEQDEAIYSLDKSPVMDVVLEKESILENRMSGVVKRRFQKLLELLSFESCIGIPIEVSDEMSYALFLFAERPDAFSIYRLRDAKASAVLIAAVIEREKLNKQAQSQGRLFLSGELTAGLSHEVYNKMSGLDIQLRNLQTDLRIASQAMPDLLGNSTYEEIFQAVDTLSETAKDLKGTVEIFQRLMKQGENQELDFNRVLKRAKILLQPIANQAGVDVKIKLDPDLPKGQGNEARILQAFLNVMINAVQQMEPFSRKGILHISTMHKPGDKIWPIKVIISDNGPGIHKGLWEKIFHLGFSTRPGGTGQGLFIARSLVEAMGGQIVLSESFVPLGTKFLFELPALREKKEVEVGIDE
jgi:signal transduction histidine kinase/predicted RNA-binding protein with RPS1 domain